MSGYQLRSLRLARSARRNNRTHADNIMVAYRIAGRLDEDVLSRAVAAVVSRHEPLRTVFPSDAEPPVAVVLPAGVVPVERHETDRWHESAETAVDGTLRELVSRRIDWEHGPMLRVTRVPFGGDEELLALTYDHLAADGVESANILARELAVCYQALAAGTEPVLPQLTTTYQQVAAVQRTRLTAARRAEIIASWRPRLPPDAPDPRLDLTPLRPGAKPAPGDTTLVERSATPSLLAVLPELRARTRSSNFVIFLAGLLAALRVLTEQEKTGALFPLDVRSRYGAQRLIGRFGGLGVIWTAVPPTIRLAEFVERVAGHVRDALADADLPFGELVREVYPDWYSRVDGPPYVFFAAQSAKPQAWTAPGLTATPVRPAAGQQLHAGLKIGVRTEPGELTMSCLFGAEAYATDRVGAVLELTLGAVETLARDPHATVADLRRLVPEYA